MARSGCKLDEHGGLLKTTIAEREIFEVIQRPRLAGGIPQADRDTLRRIFTAAETVTIIEAVFACRDPKDDKFLELAVNGHADVIVSGDADLLVLNPFRDIPILTPAGFGRAMTLMGS